MFEVILGFLSVGGLVLLSLVGLVIGMYVRMGRMERRLTDKITANGADIRGLQVGQSDKQRQIERLEDRLFEGRHTQPEVSPKKTDPGTRVRNYVT